jgi:hypothetical protein
MPALHALAQIIEKFPVKSPGDYNDAQLATARGWINDQKNLTIKP